MKFLQITFFLSLPILVFSIFLPRAEAATGTIDATYNTAKFLNSANGTINFKCTNCNISVSDSAITGFAWGDVVGWINFNPTSGGVSNTTGGVLSGYAWGENAGWINFDPSQGGVEIDTNTGEWNGYAWSQNYDWIKFDCSAAGKAAGECVKTSWRPPVPSRRTSIGSIPPPAPPPPPAPIFSQTCSPYLTKFIKLGAANDPAEVTKLQNFLIDREGEQGLSVTGSYDLATFNAVKRFQAKYASDILAPWGLFTPTGFVYRMTIYKINELYCTESKGCNPYLTRYIKLGAQNDPAEVTKLQNFLRDYEGFVNLSVTSNYDLATFNAVKAFQARYIQDILIPWGIYAPTGYVFRTTKFKINEIYCAKRS